MPKMPKNVSADKSFRRENKRVRNKTKMVVDGRSALFNRVVNQRNKKTCPICHGPKNKKSKACKSCLSNPVLEKKNELSRSTN